MLENSSNIDFSKELSLEELEELDPHTLGCLIKYMFGRDGRTDKQREINIDYLKRVLTQNPPLQYVDINGDAPLSIAVQLKNVEAIKLLLYSGADVSHNKHRPAIYYAIGTLDIDILKLILSHSPKYINGATRHLKDLIICMCFNTDPGDLKMIDLMVERGADINHQEEYVDSPLHYATRYGRIEIIEALLKNGASNNLLNSLQKTAWDLAETSTRKLVPELKPSGVLYGT